MADATGTTGTTTTAAATATGGTATPAWYEGKAAPEIVGHWQSRGLDTADPASLAIEMTKQYREAEKFISVPPSELLRIPKQNAPAADIKAFWARLGAAEAKDYDLSGVKFGDGAALDQGFADSMRAALAQNFVPKDRGASIVDAMVKYMEGVETADAAAAEQRRAAQTAALDRNWGPNKTANMLTADQGAQRLGVTAEEVKAIGEVIGLDRVAELFRKIGAGTRDDTFVDGTRGTGTIAPTADAAQAEYERLQNDREWTRRLTAGDTQARAQFDALMAQIATKAGYVPGEL